MATTRDTLRYATVGDWEQLPDGFHHGDVVGVGVDSRDRVYLLTRRESRVLIYNRDGSFVASWGENFFTPRTHGLTVAPDDSVYCIDEGRQVIYNFTPGGNCSRRLARRIPHPIPDTTDAPLTSITRGGPPFNRPTNVAIAPSGELYVSDGYGNASVHRFGSDGELIQSWGEPGERGRGNSTLSTALWSRRMDGC